jgi:hypothetical protein
MASIYLVGSSLHFSNKKVKMLLPPFKLLVVFAFLDTLFLLCI